MCLYFQGVETGGFEWSIFIAVVVAAVVFFVLGILVNMCISKPNVKAKVRINSIEKNKKVLLRKRKRHTDRRVASPVGGVDRQNDGQTHVKT